MKKIESILRKERQLYPGAYEEVLEIGQREFGVSKADSIKPVLATYGLATCIGFAGWDPLQKIGFLTHYDYYTKFPESFNYLMDCISKQSQYPKFDVRIIGGWDKSSEIITFLKSNLNNSKNIKMRLIEEDTGMSNAIVRSIAIDTRTGGTYSYFPKLNPLHKKPGSFIDLYHYSVAKLLE